MAEQREYIPLYVSWHEAPRRAGLLVEGQVPGWLMTAFTSAWKAEYDLHGTVSMERAAELSAEVVACLQQRGFDTAEAEWRLTGNVTLAGVLGG